MAQFVPGPLRRLFRGLAQHALPVPRDVLFAEHKYRGLLIRGTQEKHVIHIPFCRRRVIAGTAEDVQSDVGNVKPWLAVCAMSRDRPILGADEIDSTQSASSVQKQISGMFPDVFAQTNDSKIV
jgi:hypothetical protein